MNRRGLILIIALVLIGSLALVYIFRPRNHTVYTTTTEKQPEQGSNQPVSLVNGDKLATPLLKEQFLAARDALFIYTIATYGQSIKQISITGEPVVQPNGDLTFNVSVVDNNQQFSGVISRPTFDTIVFSVPKANYSRTINVYGGSEE